MKTDIDYSIVKDLTYPELQEYVRDNFWNAQNSETGLKKVSLIMKGITQLCGIYPSNEQYIYMYANPKKLACTACAGAGKTTMSLYRGTIAANYLGIKSKEILFLAYNKDASVDFQEKLNKIKFHVDKQKMMEKNKAFLAGKPAPEFKFTVPTDMRISTLHAWCKEWVETYRSRWGIVNFTVMSESESLSLLQQLIEAALKDKLTGERPFKLTNGHVSAFMRLYQFAEETCSLANPQEWVVSSDRAYLKDFSDDELIRVFTTYKKTKGYAHKVDFIGLLYMMEELLKDPEASERIRKHYKFVIVDEYQDFTPLMNNILKLFVKGDGNIPPYDECFLTCIGDDDQAIYQFKGASTKNFINFKENFSLTEGDTKIVSMSINRRCSKAILDIAACVAESMGDERIEKPVWGIHDGGTVDTYEYTSNTEQIDSIISHLDLDNLTRSVICYRNQNSSALLALKLMDKGIPFRLGNGIAPLQDMISRTYLGILNMLYDPLDEELAAQAFYKCMPGKGMFRKSFYSDVLRKHKAARDDYNSDLRVKAIPFYSSEMWEDNLQELESTIPGWTRALHNLETLSERLRSGELLSCLMPEIFVIVDKYYLNNLLTGLLAGRFSNEFKSHIRAYFSPDLSFRHFLKDYQSKIKHLDETSSQGVYISTFHSLKGLEYDNVYVMDMDDNIFPGADVSNPDFTDRQRKEAEYSARCLLYVVVTRAKTKLSIWFSKQRPSQYINYFSKSDLVEDLPELVSCEEDELDLAALDILKNSTNSRYIYCSKLKIQHKSYLPNELTDEESNELFTGLESSDFIDMSIEDFNVKPEVSETEKVLSAIEEPVVTEDFTDLFSDDIPSVSKGNTKGKGTATSVDSALSDFSDMFSENVTPESSTGFDIDNMKEVVVFDGKPNITTILNNLVEE